MEDPQLRELTASEQLSLTEEYEMQCACLSSFFSCRLSKRPPRGDSCERLSTNTECIPVKWQQDEDKLTFIIIDINLSPTHGRDFSEVSFEELYTHLSKSSHMIGDVNVFFTGVNPCARQADNARPHAAQANHQDSDDSEEDGLTAELEIMIAGGCH